MSVISNSFFAIAQALLSPDSLNFDTQSFAKQQGL